MHACRTHMTDLGRARVWLWSRHYLDLEWPRAHRCDECAICPFLCMHSQWVIITVHWPVLQSNSLLINPCCLSVGVSDRPELHQLNLLNIGDQQLRIAHTVGADWQQLGLALHFDHNLIRSIERDNPLRTRECCLDLLGRWLNGEACQPITWARLIQALKDAEHSTLARKLERFFTPEH